jgi:hypothetical protein
MGLNPPDFELYTLRYVVFRSIYFTAVAALGEWFISEYVHVTVYYERLLHL